MNKKAMSGFEIGILVIAALVAVQVLGIYDIVGAVKGIPTVTPPTAVSDCSICSDPSSTVTVGPTFVKWGTTALTSEWAGVLKNGVYQGLKQDSSTFTAACGDKLDIYYGLNSSVYYTSVVKDLVVPCGPLSTSERDGDSNQLMTADSSLTIDFFNEDNFNLNSITDNETISTGESSTIDFKIKSTNEQGLSPSLNGYFVMVIDLMGVEFNEGETKVIGNGWEKVSNPSVYPIRNATAKAVSFKHAGCPTGSDTMCNIEGSIYIKAESSEDPRTQINVTIYPGDYYINTDNTNLIDYGVEDNDGTRGTTYWGTGEASQTDAIYIA